MVPPARLIGVKAPTGGRVELLLLRQETKDTWQAMVRPGRRVGPGAVLSFADGALTAQVLDRTAGGGRRVRFRSVGPLDEVLREAGQVPLPPYIHRSLDDPERYQTVYAREPGSSAAPTAGLHFTQRLLDELMARGVHVVDVTLHVGPGTFRPVKAEYVDEHDMHAEYYRVPERTAETVRRARAGRATGHRRRHDHGAGAGSVLGQRRSLRLDGPVHLPRLSVAGGGRFVDQLPLAPLESADARQRAAGP